MMPNVSLILRADYRTHLERVGTRQAPTRPIFMGGDVGFKRHRHLRNVSPARRCARILARETRWNLPE